LRAAELQRCFAPHARATLQNPNPRTATVLQVFVPATLNPAQTEAVNHVRGPCLVLAGAGSGKTRVITHKIARLIQSGAEPKRLAAITFTNTAAAEMRVRARGLIGARAAEVLICTFHALGVRILREDGAALGLKAQFSILDSDDVLGLLKDCGDTTDNAQARAWQWAISGLKGAGLTAAQALERAASPGERHLAQIMQRYEERLGAYQSVDFDDLIALPLRLLSKHEEVAAKWQQRLAHVLIDEYQDTNAAQYDLLKRLVGPTGHFTAVGDDDQSIYGWRGATLDNLRRLPSDFPNLKIIKLEQNYRSTAAILEAANSVIGHNPKLFPKRLRSELGAGEAVRVLACATEQDEAQRAVQRIQALRQTSGKKEWRDFAVLYRANHQARVFEQALRRAQIPYRVSGGQSFFERAEIKDLCAWLRLWVNENDDPAFLRAIAAPRRGIGHQTLARLGEFAAQSHASLFHALFSHSLDALVTRRSADALREFGREVSDLRQRAGTTSGAAAARAFLQDWLQAIGYEQHLQSLADSKALAAARWDNVRDFCDWMAERCGGAEGDGSAGAASGKSLLDVAQTISLIATLSEREGEQNVVTLSTLHAAKGLEWPHVILAGVVEGLLPFAPEAEATSADADAVRVEEERRLMYVGITRAQLTLAVSWPRQRKKRRQVVTTRPSRFIAEMALDQATVREDPRAKLQALRAEFARRAADASAHESQAKAGI
jgi:ATP-dependent DNA helicase Rep